MSDNEYEKKRLNYHNLTMEDKSLLMFNIRKRKANAQTSADVEPVVTKSLFNFFTVICEPNFPVSFTDIAKMHDLALAWDERDMDWLYEYAEDIIKRTQRRLTANSVYNITHIGFGEYHQLSKSINSMRIYLLKKKSESLVNKC